jgi:hypothetical protein
VAGRVATEVGTVLGDEVSSLLENETPGSYVMSRLAILFVLKMLVIKTGPAYAT